MKNPYEQGVFDAVTKFAAEAAFQPVKPPPPPKPSNKPTVTPKAPATPGTIPARTVPVVPVNHAARLSQLASKFASYNFGMRARPKAKPGEIEPDNGRYLRGPTYTDAVQRKVSQGFNSLRTPQNPDPRGMGENPIMFGAF